MLPSTQHDKGRHRNSMEGDKESRARWPGRGLQRKPESLRYGIPLKVRDT